MVLNSLQCTGCPLSQRIIWALKSVTPRLRDPGLGLEWGFGAPILHVSPCLAGVDPGLRWSCQILGLREAPGPCGRQTRAQLTPDLGSREPRGAEQEAVSSELGGRSVMLQTEHKTRNWEAQLWAAGVGGPWAGCLPPPDLSFILWPPLSQSHRLPGRSELS